MSAGTRIVALGLWGLALLGSPARAQEPADAGVEVPALPPAPAEPVVELEEPPDLDEVEYFNLLDTELVKVGTSFVESVVSTTKIAQRAAQAPGVITVISAAEIEARGYRSLAEILRVVPGFYDVYDLVSHNVGIRGINGGPRAAGNVVKLLINGIRVDFRPTTGNFFGEELVPIAMVERVEIIRGPASALYGADAFLGVINVITKPGKDISGFLVRGEARAVRGNLGGGGTLVQGDAAENLDVLVGGRLLYEDRSGLALPQSSPLLQTSPSLAADRGLSTGDTSRLYSFFVRSRSVLGVGTLALQASIQRTDTAGEFQEWGPLTHDSRLTLENQTFSVDYTTRLFDTLDLRITGVRHAAGVGEGGRYNTGRTDAVYLRDTASEGFSVGTELRGTFFKTLTGTLGLDVEWDQHIPQTFDELRTEPLLASDGSVVRQVGTITPGQRRGDRRDFYNVGAFLQGLWTWSPDWSAVAGGRVDVHNIFNVVPSGRLGVVYAPANRPVSVKVLYGSSFKAPSAEQLYAEPFTDLDISGNEQLGPQTAHTFELAGAYGFAGALGELQLNLFATNILGRVEFQQRGNYLVAQNIPSEWVAGAEIYASYELWKVLRLSGSTSIAGTVARSGSPFVVDPRRVLNPLYPRLQIHTVVDYALAWAGGWQLSAEGSLIGPRSASQSNAILKVTRYALPAYFHGAFSIGTQRKIFGPRATSFVLRVSHLFDNHVDSGFAGVDVPSQGLTASLQVTQSIY